MPSRRTRVVAIAAAALIVATGSVLPAPQPARATLQVAGFQDTVVIDGLTNPMWVEFASDGRVFVAEKSGLIKVFPGLGEPGTVFADLRTETQNYWDRGLMGIALHPNFPATPWVYALYARDAPPGGSTPTWGDTCPTPPGPNTDGCVVTGRLVRLTATGNVATSSTTFLTDWCQQFPSHSVGSLVFGPDGMLYVSGGDGANFNVIDYGQRGGTLTDTPTGANPCGDPPNPSGTADTPPLAEGGALRSQDYENGIGTDTYGFSGSILRIDPVTGDAASGNPTHADASARRIIGYGLRNPFRFTFRPGSSELWIAEVGWSLREEIDRIDNAAGPVENFGWPCYEGSAKQPTYDNANLTICEELYAGHSGPVTGPWLTYPHGGPVFDGDACVASSGASLSGIAFYDGGSYPAAYDGAVFFADYTRKCIWAALPSTPGGLPSPTNLQTFMTAAAAPVGLRTGPGGDLYYVDFGSSSGTVANGAIHRIHYAPGNQPPTAAFTATPPGGPLPLNVMFNATSSSDPDPGDLLTYAWDLDNDGSFDDGTADTAQRTFTQAGDFTVRLRVTDSSSGSDTHSVIVHAGNSPPIPVINSPSSSLKWHVGETVQFSGSANDGEGGSVAASGLDWSLVMHHCPGGDCHEHQVQALNDRSSGFFVAPDHEYPSFLELVLTATDAQGLQASTSVELQPETVNLSFASSPTGAELSVGTVTDNAPFSVTAIVGSGLSVSAPGQVIGGEQRDFASWSDGGAETHDITAPASSASYTATFDPIGTVFSARRASFAQGTFTGYRFASNGTVTSTKVGTLSRASGASVDQRRLWNGRPYLHVVNGIWAGTWVPESGAIHLPGKLAQVNFPAPRRATFLAGTYSGYLLSSSGNPVSPKTATLAQASGASADARAVIRGLPYLHIVNGIWAGRWVPEHYLAISAGTRTAYDIEAGVVSTAFTYTLGAASGASAVARVAGPGGWYLAVSNGVFGDHWLKESAQVRRKVALSN